VALAADGDSWMSAPFCVATDGAGAEGRVDAGDCEVDGCPAVAMTGDPDGLRREVTHCMSETEGGDFPSPVAIAVCC
jgi:hypothetical protein